MTRVHWCSVPEYIAHFWHKHWCTVSESVYTISHVPINVTTLIKDKSFATNWSKCNSRWFKIQFKHPVGCEHYAGVRWCGRGVEDAAWQGIIYVGTWLTPCIANMSQDLQYRRPERRKWKCDENLNRCECTFSGYSTPFREPYLLQHCQQASALDLVVSTYWCRNCNIKPPSRTWNIYITFLVIYYFLNLYKMWCRPDV